MNCILKAALAMFVVALICSCSKGNDKTSSINPYTGKHPGGWAVAATGGAHPAAFISGPSACYECHGKDLSGGISKVSCFSASRSGITCHPGGPSGHPAGWASPDAHGVAAKALLAGQNGLGRCQVCHGADFSGGIVNKSCLNSAGCHGAGVMAPHSPKPWLSKTGGRTHTAADPSNAAACAVCHTNGANSSRTPQVTVAPGTVPDCFNNTLCHGVEGHAVANWTAASVHGAAAKAAAGGITVNGQASPVSSFATCTQCHGARYDGGTSQLTCLNTAGCHGANVAAPHPARPWRSTTGGVTHVTTDTSNAPQCAVCHTNGAHSTRVPIAGAVAGSSGCFNNSLCHGAEGHPAGWSAAAQHGSAAKSAPGNAAGFSYCQQCHGPAFNNGAAPSCMNTLSCHGLLVSSPHPAKPWTSKVTAASTHTNTDPANAVTCAICHTGGANSSLVPPAPAIGIAGCYNNTLCHFHALPFAPPAVAPSVHGGLAKQNLTVCQSCHGIKGSTSFDGLAVGNGAKTIACSSCHTFAKAHPTVWQGSSANPGETVIYSHRTAGSIADSCALCHDVTKGRTAPLPAAPSCFSATFTNPLTLTAGACHANGPGAAAHIVPYPNHGAAAGSNVNYCLGCHQVAANAAGSKPPGCQNCHLSSPVVTPTGCTSCHAKPPAGLSYPDLAGLHASHAAFNVTQNANLTAVCDQCHSGLGLGTLDHLNRARSRTASVQANPAVFGSLATTGGLSPVYSGATRTCANTYCHGSSLAGFSLDASVIRVPSWSTPFPAGTHCDKCHGYPPATASHASLPGPAQCINCHSHVNASGTGFTDPAKHINGVVEAAGGHSFPNPGSVHRVAANGVGCLSAGCHVLGSAVSLYPVSSGTPPDCRGCHLGANPGTDPQCSDCHGSVTNNGAGSLLAGRPVGGAAFPNRPGQHNRSEHVGRACTFCHPLTSGNSSHGWSNRLKSNAAKVGGAGTSITSWNAVTKSCSPTCHGSQIW